MRSVSATLGAAQSAVSGRVPYIKMVFTSADDSDTQDFSSGSSAYGNRILLIDHNEEAYNDFATIVLSNHDRAVPDLTGYWTEIGYGDTTGAGDEYIGDGTSEGPTPRLWVKNQQFVSAGGRVICILELRGMWTKLAEQPILIGSPPFYSTMYTTDTVYAIISAILTELGHTLQALGSQDDGVIDDYTPEFVINTIPFEDAAYICKRLINMTACFLRPKPSLEWEIRYPQESDTADETYYSDEAPYFIEYIERKGLLIPNHIYCFANAGEDGEYDDLISAEASNAEEIAKYCDVPDIVVAPEVTTQEGADNRASAALARAKAEALAGRLIIPHDCRMELYDKPLIYDRRGV